MSIQQHYDRCPICEDGIITQYSEPQPCSNECDGRVDDSDTELAAVLFRLAKRFPRGRTLAKIAQEAVDSIWPGTPIWKTGQDSYGWFWMFDVPDRHNPFPGFDVSFMLHENGDGYFVVEQVHDNWVMGQDGSGCLYQDPPRRVAQVNSEIRRGHLTLIKGGR